MEHTQHEVLTPYCKNNVHRKNFPEPPPDLINGEEEYKVESIRDHKNKAKAINIW